MKAIVRRQTIIANPRRHKIVVFRSHPGPPGIGATEAMASVNALRDLATGGADTLDQLTTDDKTSLVAAINELKAQLGALS